MNDQLLSRYMSIAVASDDAGDLGRIGTKDGKKYKFVLAGDMGIRRGESLKITSAYVATPTVSGDSIDAYGYVDIPAGYYGLVIVGGWTKGNTDTTGAVTRSLYVPEGSSGTLQSQTDANTVVLASTEPAYMAYTAAKELRFYDGTGEGINRVITADTYSPSAKSVDITTVLSSASGIVDNTTKYTLSAGKIVAAKQNGPVFACIGTVAADGTTVTLAGGSATNSYYNGMQVTVMVSDDDGSTQSLGCETQTIASYVGSSKVATLVTAIQTTALRGVACSAIVTEVRGTNFIVGNGVIAEGTAGDDTAEVLTDFVTGQPFVTTSTPAAAQTSATFADANCTLPFKLRVGDKIGGLITTPVAVTGITWASATGITTLTFTSSTILAVNLTRVVNRVPVFLK